MAAKQSQQEMSAGERKLRMERSAGRRTRIWIGLLPEQGCVRR